jgi:Delta7-sterol 5-desaturase
MIQTWLVTLMGLFLFRVVVLAGLGFALQRLAWSRRRQVFSIAPPPGQKWNELRAGLVVLAFDAAMFTAIGASGLSVDHPFTVGGFGLGVVLAFSFNEVWFYVTHRLLHTRPLFFIHAQHHTARVADPMSSVSFSLGEHVLAATPAMLFTFALSRFLPVPAIAGAVVGVLIELGNVYGHSNVEVWPAGFPRSLAGQVWNTPTHHALHHARFNGHYGLYTRFLDRLFRTEWSDYEAIQERAASGRALPTLSSRAEGA